MSETPRLTIDLRVAEHWDHGGTVETTHREATPADLIAAVASLDGAFQLEPDEPLDWYVDGQLDRTIMPGRYLVVPLPDTEPEEERSERVCRRVGLCPVEDQ